MGTFERHLKVFETTNLIKSQPLTGSLKQSFSVSTGSRLILSLYIAAIDVGAIVTLKVLNGFTQDLPLDEILLITTTQLGYETRILTDFHNGFEIEVSVAGGSATVALGATLADNANSTRIENAVIETSVSAYPGVDGKSDSIRLSDGRYETVVNPDGSINVNIVQGSPDITEVVREFYSEAPAVVSGSETSVISYTVPVGKKARLQKIEFSGSNTAEYRYYKNGTITGLKRTHHGSGLTDEFVFFSGSEEGIPLAAGDVVSLTAKHSFRESGDFEARLQVLELG